MKVIRGLLVAPILILNLVIPVNAQVPQIGDKSVLPGGYETEVIGFTDEAKPIYRATFGLPKYLPDLTTRIDTTWNDSGTYQSGANLFEASVDNQLVSVLDKKGNSLSWLPTVTVDNFEKAKDKSGITEGIQTATPKAKLLTIDPMNENYRNNTLEWDYGNGVFRRLRIIEGMIQEYYVITKAIGGDFNIRANIGKSSNYKSDRKAVAFDNDHNIIDLIQDEEHNVKLTKDKSLDAKIKYPIIIDPDSTFAATSSDGMTLAFDNVFANVRTATSSATANSTSSFAYVLSSYNGSQYMISRFYPYFDTSALSGYVVTAAVLYLRGEGYKDDTNAYSVQVQSGQPTYPHDPLVIADYNQANYAGNGGSIVVGAWAVTGYNAITITDLAFINTTGGTTKLCLRMTGDINNTAPTGYNEVNFYTYEMGTGYLPALTVTYTALTAGVTSQPASSVAKTTARLNAIITGDGGADCTVSWGYGTTTQTAANFALYDTVTAFTTETYRVGDRPYLDVTGLIANTQYFFRIQVKNVLATVTSVDEQTFTTTTDIAESTNFYGIPSSTEIDLSWVRGAGSSQVLIRYRPDTYPTGTTNGNQVYLGAESTYTHSGLTPGKTYYYSLWGESGGVYSTDYYTLAVTTLGTDPGTENDPTTPTLWEEFFQLTDASGLTNLEPFPDIITAAATSWQMPVNNMWFLGTMGFIFLCAVGTLLKYKSLLGAGVLTLALMGFAVTLHLIPLWMMGVTIMILLGGLTLWRMKPA